MSLNWDAIGAIAQLAGAVGVVASLAYLIVTNENAFYRRKDGMLSEARTEQLLQSLRWFFLAPGFREWWRTYPKDTLHPEFVAMLDDYMAEAENAG